MKTIARICAAAMLLLVACAPKEEPQDLGGQTMTIHATLEPETRTTLRNGGTQVYWEPGDAISVFYKGASGYFVSMNSSLATVADFTGSLPISVGAGPEGGSSNYIWGLYPYSRRAEWSNSSSGECVITSLPDIQYARAGSFAEEANIAVARSTGMDLAFYNALGGLRFTLTQEGIDEIRFRMNGVFPLTGGDYPVAGDILIRFTDDGLPQTSVYFSNNSSHSSEIVLKAPEHTNAFQTGVWYYISLIPMEMSEGFTLEFHKADGAVATKTTTNSFTVSRGIFGSVQNIDAGLEFTDDRFVDLGLSVKWASCNLGGTAPEQAGEYYAFGETEPKRDYSWSTYRWCNGDGNSLTKYVIWRDYGQPDGLMILQPDDDPARANWGGNWRVPTLEEWRELQNGCTWTWTTQDGMAGYSVVGSTGKSIFLPAAGAMSGTTLQQDGVQGSYLAATVPSGQTSGSHGFTFQETHCIAGTVARYGGNSVRPVYAEPTSVSWISIDKGMLTLSVGETATLTATVLPETAANKNVTWYSSNPFVASVDGNGKITAVAPGAVHIYVTTADGERQAHCKVNVQIAGVESVDLGLSVNWATFNIGATAPEGYGDFFAWGEIATKQDYSWATYSMCGGTSMTMTQYNTLDRYGTVDGRTKLFYDEFMGQYSDDVACRKWGGEWRMPTLEEQDEIRTECTWTWTTVNGVQGCKAVSKKAGYEGNWIFFPAAGYMQGTSLMYQGTSGYFWSSEINPSYPNQANNLFINSSGAKYKYYNRCLGYSVRPVIRK